MHARIHASEWTHAAPSPAHIYAELQHPQEEPSSSSSGSSGSSGPTSSSSSNSSHATDGTLFITTPSPPPTFNPLIATICLCVRIYMPFYWVLIQFRHTGRFSSPNLMMMTVMVVMVVRSNICLRGVAKEWEVNVHFNVNHIWFNLSYFFSIIWNFILLNFSL